MACPYCDRAVNYKLIFIIVPDLNTPLDSAIGTVLASLQFDTVLGTPSDAAQRMQELGGRGAEPSVVLIGPGIRRPCTVARAIRTVWPIGQILFVPAQDQFETVRNELRYVPALGPNWSLLQLSDPFLGAKMSRAVQASRQRARLRTTLDRANIRLAAPKPVDSMAYRQSVISEHYLASLLQHSADAIFSLDPRNNILYWSTGAERLFRVSPRYNQPAAELPFWSASLDPLLAQIRAGASSVTIQVSAVIEARPLHLDVSMARVQDENHVFIGTSITVRDVSDAVRAIETERAARRHAEQLGRVKDEFLAVLSHELRTPLSAVIGRTQLLRMQHRDAPGLQTSLEVIERNAKLQAKLIEDLLDVSSIVTGKLTLDMRPIGLGELLKAVAESVKAMAEAKMLVLATDNQIGGVMISGDTCRLHQVFYNLLTNAIKFTPAGGTVTVHTAIVPGNRVQIVIADTGCGIAPEFVPHVFGKFEQEDASITRRHGGLGLGLSITKQLVTLHGGTIAAASPGRGLGTRFTLAFPIRPAEGCTLPVRPNPAYPTVRSNRLAQRRVLVVEDVADTRDLITDVLIAHGAQVLGAPSALAALELLQTGVADVLVSDIGMPDMDGYQLIGEVRRRGFSDVALPALALTAYASPLDRQRALDAGFQAHLAKPHIVKELVSTLGEMLRRHDNAGN